MSVQRAGSQPSKKGPAENFTGVVRIDPLFMNAEPAACAGVNVTFEPGARTFWHTHPLGQTLLVVSGCGWTQCEGEAIEVVRPGDVVQCPAHVRHWHGATADTAMTHTAITPILGGKAVEWLEPVSDEQYLAFGSEKHNDE